MEVGSISLSIQPQELVGFSEFLWVLLPHVVPIFNLAVCCG